MDIQKLEKLLQSWEHRGYKFKNRFGMAAMTRCRADPDGTPNDLNKAYYTQRAESVAFMSTEAMGVMPNCNPWGASCNVYTTKAVQKWREINDEIHKHGAYIFAQLVHGGRTVHPDFNNGIQPMGPSAILLKGEAHTPLGKKPHVLCREMTKQDIQTIKDAFRISINNSIAAGFDGVEFHGANGYMIDQFLRSGSNNRTDEYGGSIENRCRFLLELVDLALTLIPAHKIGVKISLVGRYQDMYDEDPEKLGQYLLTELSHRKILYVVMGSPESFGDGAKQIANTAKFGRRYFNGLIVGDGHIELEERLRRVSEGEADIANFGALMWANPDLVERLKNNWPLSAPDFQFMYAGGPKSYADIPRYDPKSVSVTAKAN